MTAEALVQMLPNLSIDERGAEYAMKSDYDALGSWGGASELAGVPALDFEGITGRWSATVDKTTMLMQDMAYTVLIPLGEPSAPESVRSRAGMIEVRMSVVFSDFDDPSITVEPPAGPLPGESSALVLPAPTR
jgi:hypothetical protein